MDERRMSGRLLSPFISVTKIGHSWSWFTYFKSAWAGSDYLVAILRWRDLHEAGDCHQAYGGICFALFLNYKVESPPM